MSMVKSDYNLHFEKAYCIMGGANKGFMVNLQSERSGEQLGDEGEDFDFADRTSKLSCPQEKKTDSSIGSSRAAVAFSSFLTLFGCAEAEVVGLQNTQERAGVVDRSANSGLPVFGKVTILLGTGGIEVIGDSTVSTLIEITLKRNGEALESKPFFIESGKFNLKMDFQDAKPGDSVTVSDVHGKGYLILITSSDSFPGMPSAEN